MWRVAYATSKFERPRWLLEIHTSPSFESIFMGRFVYNFYRLLSYELDLCLSMMTNKCMLRWMVLYYRLDLISRRETLTQLDVVDAI